jgi:hypothetical protein
MHNLVKWLLASAVFWPVTAFGACHQIDLTGTWRFNINTGQHLDNANHTDILSCLIIVSATGAFTVRSCETLNSTGHAGTIVDNSPQRKLHVSAGCEVRLTGQPVFTNDLEITIGGFGYFANGIALSMSASRDVMLGYASVSGNGQMAISAVKRKP